MPGTAVAAEAAIAADPARWEVAADIPAADIPVEAVLSEVVPVVEDPGQEGASNHFSA